MATPLPTIPGCFRVTFNWTSASQIANNVIHIGQGVGGTATVDQLHTALLAHVTAAMWTPVATGSLVTGIEIIELDGTSATVTYGAPTPSTNWTGGTTGDQVPQVAAVVSIATGLRGRNRRGRLYLPFISEGGIQSGTLLSPGPGNTTNAWNTFIAAMLANTPSFSMGMASYDRLHGGAGAGFFPAQTMVCRTILGTQRRRQSRLR